MRLTLATFNLRNLALPNSPMYTDLIYNEDEYEEKINWTAQQLQRALVNGDPNLLAGAYMPFTNFQNTLNGPSMQAMLDQATNDSNSPAAAAQQLMMNQQLQGANAAQFDANARAIMGL